jgi:F420-non-reducing hydrogenase iron-sulfur subunit
MKLLGIEDARLRKEWISASEGTRFAEVIREFTEEVRKVGKNPLVKRETAA